jgi:flagella basal body P-ring formation protein FlgA
VVTSVVAAAGPGAPAADPPAGAGDEEVRLAIERVVCERVGGDARVVVSDLTIVGAGSAEGPLRAVPEPGMRLGRPARFTLGREVASSRTGGASGFTHRRWAGEATATVRVVARHARPAASVARGQILRAADLDLVVADIGSQILRPLPQDLAGARALREIPAGAVVTAAMVRPAPVVRTGDEVRARVRLGPAEIVGLAVAQQAGGVGDVIRVVNRTSRRALRGRVVGPQEVEVVP